MFVMNPQESDTPLSAKEAAVNSLTALLAGLTGRLADPVHVNQVIDDILACSTAVNPVHPTKERK